MNLFIKNMMCIRCIMVVKSELDKLNINYKSVELGKVETTQDLSSEQLNNVRIALCHLDLELINNKKVILVEKIKNLVKELIQLSDSQLKINFSDYLSKKSGFDYTYLSNIFSEELGITIEHYVISNKIQRVKELIEYNELNLTQISWKMNYSSVAHLSSQFKKVTGVTPSLFRKAGHRDPLELQNM